MVTRISPTQDFILCKNPIGFHHMRYWTWGMQDKPVLIMVHGLSRNGRDFDVLAEALSDQYFVVCPDIVGRGVSDWLPEGVDYSYTQYMHDLTALIARLNVNTIHWLGSSMGGLLGMIMGALVNSPITKLVINDIGPFIDAQSLTKIRQYVGMMPTFKTLEAAANFIRQMYRPFGNLTDDQWEHMVTHSVIRKSTNDAHFYMHYDPRVTSFDSAQDVNLWSVWNAVRCPTLVIRGEQSTIFPDAIYQQMLQKENTAGVVIANAGHAPALMSTHEVESVRAWLCG